MQESGQERCVGAVIDDAEMLKLSDSGKVAEDETRAHAAENGGIAHDAAVADGFVKVT